MAPTVSGNRFSGEPLLKMIFPGAAEAITRPRKSFYSIQI